MMGLYSMHLGMTACRRQKPHLHLSPMLRVERRVRIEEEGVVREQAQGRVCVEVDHHIRPRANLLHLLHWRKPRLTHMQTSLWRDSCLPEAPSKGGIDYCHLAPLNSARLTGPPPDHVTLTVKKPHFILTTVYCLAKQSFHLPFHAVDLL